MPNMELITSVTVGSGGAASVTLPASGTIPQTYTDLKILISARDNSAQIGNNILMQINGGTTSQSVRAISGDGSSTPNSYSATPIFFTSNGNSSTADTFSNMEVYIPNYASTTTYKSVSVDSVSENNGTTALAQLTAGLYASNNAITTISFVTNGGPNILEGSTFYLYGISSVTSTPKATGGIVSQDADYWYHMFPFTSTFTPNSAIICDYLVIAGGGGGGWGTGGGAGGAGGLRSTVTATGGGGTLETALSLSAQAYTVTVGAGGVGLAQVPGTVPGNPGNDSTFSTITSTGGGYGGSETGSYKGGSNGGSGGGANYLSGAVAGTGTANQGYNGGTQSGYCGGGGGGAGAAGGNANSPTGGHGGNGVSIPAFANATGTGLNSYYAGGEIGRAHV
jgi:hypothetical protein